MSRKVFLFLTVIVCTVRGALGGRMVNTSSLVKDSPAALNDFSTSNKKLSADGTRTKGPVKILTSVQSMHKSQKQRQANISEVLGITMNTTKHVGQTSSSRRAHTVAALDGLNSTVGLQTKTSEMMEASIREGMYSSGDQVIAGRRTRGKAARKEARKQKAKMKEVKDKINATIWENIETIVHDEIADVVKKLIKSTVNEQLVLAVKKKVKTHVEEDDEKLENS